MKALICRGILCLGITLSITIAARAQSSSVTIGPGALKTNAVLWLVPTGGQGLILPSVATGTRTGMSLNNSDDKGMMVFDNQLNKVFYWSGTAWVDCGPGSGGGDSQDLTLTGTTLSLSNDGTPVILGALSILNAVSGGAAGTITDATIVNADISTTAAIAVTKLAAGSNAQVLTTVGGVPTWAAASAGTDSQDLTLTGSTLSLSGDATPVALGGLSILSAVSGGAAGTITDASITSADLAASSVSGGAAGTIADGTIVNADLSATAAIAVTKLAAGTNTQVLTTVGGVPTWAAAPAGSDSQDLTLTGSTLSLSGDATPVALGGLSILSAVSGGAAGTITDATITNADIAAAAAIDVSKLNSGGAGNNGLILKVVAGALTFANDDVGGGATPTLATGQVLVGNGTSNTAAAVGGDLTMSNGNFQIATGTIANADLSATAAIAVTKLAAGTNTQVLTTVGGVPTWAAASAGTDSQDLTLTGSTLSLSGDATPVALGGLSILSAVSGGAAGTITDASITSNDLAAGSVSGGVAGTITDASITSNDLAAGSVSGGAAGTISDGTIVNADLSTTAAIAVTKLAPGTNTQVLTTVGGVPTWAAASAGTDSQDLTLTGSTLSLSGDATPVALGGLSILSAVSGGAAGTITDASITSNDLAAGSVSGGLAGTITDASITSNDLAAGSVSGGAAGTITDGTIVNADLSATAAIAVTKLAAGTNTQVLTTVGGVPTWAAASAGTDSQDLTLTGSTLSLSGDATPVALGGLSILSAVSGGAAGTITDASITSADLAAGSVSGGAAGTITDASITSNDLAAGSVSGGAAGTITDGTIVNADLSATAAIAVTKIAAGTNTQVLTTVAGVPTWATPAVGTDSQDLTLTGSTLSLSGDATPVALGGLSILNAVSGGAAGTITDASITSADLAAGSVTGGVAGPITDGSITNADVSATAAIAVTKLAPGTNTQVLTTVGGVPTWAASTDAQDLSLSGTTLSLTNDGTSVALGGLSILDQINLNSGQVTDILQVANGGTGRATWNGLLLGSGATIGDISNGTNGQILRIGGTTPGWANFAVTSADITDGTIASIDIGDGLITGADLATNINITTTGNITTNAPGNLSIAGTSTLAGNTTVSTLSGAGTRMVVASPTGLLSTQALPAAGWSLLGNAGTTAGTNFIGTTDAQDVVIKVNNATRITVGALETTTTSTNPGSQVFTARNGATTGTSYGLYGESASPAGAGILGNSFVGGNGVHGFSNSGNGVAGFSTTGIGVYGQSGGTSPGVNGYNPATGPGVSGTATAATQAGVFGINDIANGYGIYGTSVNGFAGYFNGRLVANGPVGLGPTPNFGTAGQVLSSNGAAAAPSWITVSGVALSTNNVIPKGNGTTQVASSMTDNGTTVSTTLDFNIASTKAYMINNVDVLRVSGGVNGGLYVGDNAGPAATGVHNTAIGVDAGNSTTTGTENTFVGRRAGYSNTNSFNTFIGKNAGYFNVGAGLNTYVGWHAGYNAAQAQGGSTYMGAESGSVSTGDYNTFIGERSGTDNGSGEMNTFVGRRSGYINVLSNRMVLIGHEADVTSAALTLNNAVAIGYQAKVSASNSFILGGTGTAAVNVGIGLTAATTDLHVVHANGSAATDGFTLQNIGANNESWTMFVSNATGNLALYDNFATLRGQFDDSNGNYTPTSDRRLKKNIVDIEKVLPKISAMQIRRYHFKKQDDSEQTNIGVIAQELKEVFPELVKYSPESDVYTVDYMSMGPIAIKAIQEQQEMIDNLKKKVAELEASLQKEKSGNQELSGKIEALANDIDYIKRSVGLDQKAKK